ncbi:MAG TPA: FGGY family carbohydrate kinase [Candidatus Brocadiia bacterium]|nr:FGGY family carbohydrate kinase [Candidatus Brocadiia bacterium]
MEYLLGVDVGSTNLKAVLFNDDGEIVSKGSQPTELGHPDGSHPDWAVWEPDAIWGGVAASIREAVSGVDASCIRGVAVTGMGMDGLPVDRDGKWLYPFISWHCPRTIPQQEWWVKNIGAERQFEIGGDQIWPFNTALRLRWMREHEPAILDRAFKWVLIEDYINLMLCGEYATDYSMASNTLLFDLRTRAWSDELLSRSGVDRNLLCEPRPAGTVLGKVHARAAEATGLARGTPVVLGGHDYSCGCLPTGAFRPGALLDVLGTWEMVVTALSEPVLTENVRKTGALVDAHVARDRWAVMGAAVAADMLEWFRQELGGEERRAAEAEGKVDWDLLISLAESSKPGSNGLFFLPHMSGSHCPVPDHLSAGSFAGLRNTHKRADLFRAVIEGVNYQFLQILRAFQENVGIKAEQIVAIGGPTKNRFWMQNKADVCGMVIQVPDLSEAVPLGAALLAGIGAGVYRDETEAFERVWREGIRYEPDPGTTEEYEAHFQKFGRLYPALRNFYHDQV